MTKPQVERDLARGWAKLELPAGCPYAAGQVLDPYRSSRDRYGFE